MGPGCLYYEDTMRFMKQFEIVKRFVFATDMKVPAVMDEADAFLDEWATWLSERDVGCDSWPRLMFHKAKFDFVMELIDRGLLKPADLYRFFHEDALNNQTCSGCPASGADAADNA